MLKKVARVCHRVASWCYGDEERIDIALKYPFDTFRTGFNVFRIETLPLVPRSLITKA